ncbi:hypothetical protein HRbin32_01301 [bacterium HR32]|nr:hypothetical protein HRbin32_01301 [bacterium HR32]
MPFAIRSILADYGGVVAGSEEQWDLPVNPLSHVDVTLRATMGPGLADVRWAELWDLVAELEVAWRGATIIGARGQDVAALGYAMWTWLPVVYHGRYVNGHEWVTTLRVAFGRYPYWPEEMLPPVRRGELTLRIRWASAFGPFSGVSRLVETTEVPDAQPRRFLKVTTLVHVPTATGPQDVDLPLGNPIVGVILRGANVRQTSGGANTIEGVEVLVDNVEYWYTGARWDSLHQEFARRGPSGLWFSRAHEHRYDPTGTAVTFTDRAHQYGLDWLDRYAYLEFDPFTDPDLAWALHTAGRSRVHLRLTAGDTGEMRVLPIEVVRVPER